MKRYKLDKPMVESPYPPTSQYVYWVDVDEQTDQLRSIKQFNATSGRWEEAMVNIKDLILIFNGITYYPNLNSVSVGDKTTATGQDQFVFGRKNEQDTTKAEIVGGGSNIIAYGPKVYAGGISNSGGGIGSDFYLSLIGNKEVLLQTLKSLGDDLESWSGKTSIPNTINCPEGMKFFHVDSVREPWDHGAQKIFGFIEDPKTGSEVYVITGSSSDNWTFGTYGKQLRSVYYFDVKENKNLTDLGYVPYLTPGFLFYPQSTSKANSVVDTAILAVTKNVDEFNTFTGEDFSSIVSDISVYGEIMMFCQLQTILSVPKCCVLYYSHKTHDIRIKWLYSEIDVDYPVQSIDIFSHFTAEGDLNYDGGSNIRTLDWDGTQWNAGDLTCTAVDGTTISVRDLLARIKNLEASLS